MDWGILLSIIGILLTILGFFISTNKNYSTTKINNSFNSITNNINQDNRTVINKNYYTPQYTSPSISKYEDSSDSFLGFIICALIAIGIIIFLYLKFINYIVSFVTLIPILGVLISLIILFINRYTIPLKEKYLIFLSWCLTFIILLIYKFPFFKPLKLDYIIKTILGGGIIKASGNITYLMGSGYNLQIYFLVFQFLGLILALFLCLGGYYFLYKILKEKGISEKEAKNMTIAQVIIFFLSILMVSGLFLRLIFAFQKIS